MTNYDILIAALKSNTCIVILILGVHYYSMFSQVQMSCVELGKSIKEKQESVGDVMNELAIIKKELKHPNIVKYIETFRASECDDYSLTHLFNRFKQRNLSDTNKAQFVNISMDTIHVDGLASIS